MAPSILKPYTAYRCTRPRSQQLPNQTALTRYSRPTQGRVRRSCRAGAEARQARQGACTPVGAHELAASAQAGNRHRLGALPEELQRDHNHRRDGAACA